MTPADIRRKVARFETCIAPDDRDIFYLGNALADVVEAGKALHDCVSHMRVPQTVADAALQTTITIGPALLTMREALAHVEALKP